MKSLPILFSFLAMSAWAEPLALHPENPHYFLFRGKPAVLVTSGEHYGAVLNLDFDYGKYLDALAADGLNLTRTFSGSYVEPIGAFGIAENTLAPQPGRFLAPWARSEQLDLPAGKYRVEWLDVISGKTVASRDVAPHDGLTELKNPAEPREVAVRVMRGE
jgi:hypothetical protein